MKKILLLSVLFMGAAISVSAMDIPLPPSVGGLQSPGSQMRLLEQQQFRKEEYNEFKDMKQQKEERNKKINLEQKYNQNPQTQPLSTPQDINIIKENGQIKLAPVKPE